MKGTLKVDARSLLETRLNWLKEERGKASEYYKMFFDGTSEEYTQAQYYKGKIEAYTESICYLAEILGYLDGIAAVQTNVNY